VTEGSLHKGDFVVLLGTLIKFQSQIGTLYTDLQSLRSAYVPISKLAELLNANTRRKQLRKGASRREIVMQKVYEQFPDFKEQAIYVAPNTVVEYHTVTDSRSIVKRVKFPAAGLNIELGQMNCLLSTASGKATFLKSIARFLLPVEGFVHYPENLRVRFLSADIHIFNNSLMMNLRFGGQKDPDGNLLHTEDEIWELCRQLGLSDYLVGDADFHLGADGEKVAQSDRVKIVLARALLSSVDLLLLSNTLDVLNPQELERIIKVFNRMVNESGLNELSAERIIPKHLKKKKTILINSAHVRVQMVCDHFINISEDEVLLELKIQDMVQQCDPLPPADQATYLNSLSSEARSQVLPLLSKAALLVPLFTKEKI